MNTSINWNLSINNGYVREQKTVYPTPICRRANIFCTYVPHERRHTGKYPICNPFADHCILPPWYASTWAYIIYAILGICAFGGWFYWYRKHKNEQFSEQQKLFEIEKEKELNQNKVEFFTEIAHEIRTPLTLSTGRWKSYRKCTFRTKN